jgi:hypothetical protein
VLFPASLGVGFVEAAMALGAKSAALRKWWKGCIDSKLRTCWR